MSRSRAVLIVCLLLTCVAGIAAADLEPNLDPYSSQRELPRSAESARVAERVADARGSDPVEGITALVRIRDTPDDAEDRANVTTVYLTLLADPAVAVVRAPSGSRNRMQVSRDGSEVAIFAEFRPMSAIAQQRAAQRLRDRLGGIEGVQLGGKGIGFAEGLDAIKDDLKKIELLTLPLLFLGCLWFFRGVVAAIVPPALAGVATVLTLGSLRVLSEVMSVSVFAVNLVSLLALGLAIDFSLFLLARYREELASGRPLEEALARARRTAGRTILISSATITGSLAALLVFPQPFVRSLAVGGMLVTVLIALLVLVVLPALLRVLGPRIDALAPPLLRRAAVREARPLPAGAWYRLSRAVLRRPLIVTVAAALAMLVIALPATELRAISIEPEALPPGSSTAQVQQQLQDDYPVPLAAPLTAIVDDVTIFEADTIGERLATVDGVARVLPPQPLGDGAVALGLLLRDRPPSPAAERTVRALRDVDARVTVGGAAALALDEREEIVSRLPMALAILIGVTLLLVFALTRSVVLPVKSVVMNMLTIAGALGVLVVVLQDGRLEGLLDYSGDGGLTLATLLFVGALAFGLSTDYGMLVLSRIREARDAGASDDEAVAIGLERTGRLVTAAALLFVIAVGGFAFAGVQTLKEAGIGLAAAVALDALIVRSLLVPGLMGVLGRWNWWNPLSGLRTGPARHLDHGPDARGHRDVRP